MRISSRHKLHAFSAIIFGLTLSLGSCTNSTNRYDNNAERIVVVSIPPLAYFAEGIGGDRIKVECLAPASADPETFEPSMAQLRKAADSQLLFTVGLLPFEEKVTNAISSSNPNIRIVELSDSIHLIEGTHNHGTHHSHDCEHEHKNHSNYDPHIWTSLRNARIMVHTTFRALAGQFPNDTDYFKARLDSIDIHLDSIDREISAKLSPLKGEAILVWHPSLSYFSRDYDLRQLAVGQEHKEFSITDLKNRLDKVKTDKPLVFFYQKEYDSRQSQTITNATGLNPIVIAPLSPNVEDAVRKAADALIATIKE